LPVAFWLKPAGGRVRATFGGSATPENAAVVVEAAEEAAAEERTNERKKKSRQKRNKKKRNKK